MTTEDKRIDQLPAVTALDLDSLLVLQQNLEGKKLTLEQLAAYLQTQVKANIVVGPTQPAGPALWFDTSPELAGVSLLSLDEDESGYTSQLVVEDEVYGIQNAAVSAGEDAGSYDFTVL